MSKTQQLRDECERRGIEYTCGLLFDGRRVNKENVTTLWDGTDASKSLTFEEDESGALWCADELSVTQAVGAYLAGTENAKMRKLFQKAWKWERNGCHECPLEKDCKVLCVYDGDCGMAVEIEKELQELGIEVPR